MTIIHGLSAIQHVNVSTADNLLPLISCVSAIAGSRFSSIILWYPGVLKAGELQGATRL
jgi:hypothetical protein